MSRLYSSSNAILRRSANTGSSSGSIPGDASSSSLSRIGSTTSTSSSSPLSRIGSTTSTTSTSTTSSNRSFDEASSVSSSVLGKAGFGRVTTHSSSPQSFHSPHGSMSVGVGSGQSAASDEEDDTNIWAQEGAGLSSFLDKYGMLGGSSSSVGGGGSGRSVSEMDDSMSASNSGTIDGTTSGILGSVSADKPPLRPHHNNKKRRHHHHRKLKRKRRKRGHDQHPFFLTFRSSDLESDYLNSKFGTRRNIGLFVAFFGGAWIVLSLMFMQDDLHSGTPVLFPITRIVVMLWMLLVSFLLLCPCFIAKKWLFELFVLLTYCSIDLRFAVRDLYSQGYDPPFSALKSGLGFFEIVLHVIIRPRVMIAATQLLISCVVFSVLVPIFWRYVLVPDRGEDAASFAPFASTLGFWFYAGQIFFMVYVLNRTDRAAFVVDRLLSRQQGQLSKATATTRTLLKNILPSKFISAIMDGELEDRPIRKTKLGRRPTQKKIVIGKKKREDIMVLEEVDGEDEDDDDEIEVTSSIRRRKKEMEMDDLMSRHARLGVGCFIEAYNDGVVLECDLVEFTAWAQATHPETVTRVLHAYYTVFDVLSEKFGIEKLRTVGDAWWGLGFDRRDWVPVVALAVGLIAGVRSVNGLIDSLFDSQSPDGCAANLKLRVGVAGGRCLYVAVLGSVRESISFDAFGELCREAVRLEQEAPCDGVRVSEGLIPALTESFYVTKVSGSGDGEIAVPETRGDDIGPSFMHEVGVGSVINDAVLAGEVTRGLRKGIRCVRRDWEGISALSSVRVVGMNKERPVTPRGTAQDLMSPNSPRLMSTPKTLQSKTNDAVVVPKPRFNLKAWCSEKIGKVHCVSSNGLIYPLSMFSSLGLEWKCQRDVFVRNRWGNAFFFIWPFLYNVVLLVLCATQYPDETVATANPFVIAVYACLGLDYMFVCTSVYLTLRFGRVPHGVYAAFYWIDFLFHEAESILSILYSPSPASIRQFLYLAHYGYMCALDAGHPLLVRAGVLLFESVVVVVDSSYNFLDTPFLIENLQYIGLMWFAFFLGVFRHDLLVKRLFSSTVETVVQTVKIRDEKRKNENLLQSVLPKSVLRLLFHLHGHSFSARMEPLFVCFMKTSTTVSTEKEEAKAVESDVMFVTSICHEFDVVLRNDPRCLRVKRFYDTYMFISKSGDEESLVACLEVIDQCCKVFRNCLSWFYGEDSGKPERSLKIGLSYGQFHSGVFGRNRFQFDILGSVVNTAARLCETSEPYKTAVADEVLSPFLESDEFELEDRGSLALKGIGETKCSYISLKDGSAGTRDE